MNNKRVATFTIVTTKSSSGFLLSLTVKESTEENRVFQNIYLSRSNYPSKHVILVFM